MFDAASLAQTIPVLLYGMGGIFLVIGTIVLATMALTKLFPPKPKE